MEFFFRKRELKSLNNRFAKLDDGIKVSVVMGASGVGKTRLVKEYTADKDLVYLPFLKKNKFLLIEEFAARTFKDTSAIQYRDWKQVLIPVFVEAIDKKAVLVFDNIQNIKFVDEDFYKALHELISHYKYQSKLHICILGSGYSKLTQVFKDYDSPLFDHIDDMLHLKPFSIEELAVFVTRQSRFGELDLQDCYLATGGKPRQLTIVSKIMEEKHRWSIEDYLESWEIKDEGFRVLEQELGKESSTYFSLLQLIADGINDRKQIENKLQKNIGGYLDRLEKDYSLVERLYPFSARRGGRSVRYHIKDPFLIFWFTLVYKHVGEDDICELDLNELQEEWGRYVEMHQATFLMHYHKGINQYTKIAPYWDRKVSFNIPLIGLNHSKREIVYFRPDDVDELDVRQVIHDKLLINYPGYQLRQMEKSAFVF